MKEQLITFETAKLAKEKGFNDHFYHKKDEDSSRWWKCSNCYDPKDETKTLQLWSDNIFNSTDDRLERLVSAPTQSLLQKWLREVHNIDVESYLIIRVDGTTTKTLEQPLHEKRYNANIFINGLLQKRIKEDSQISPELALIDALPEALNYINTTSKP